MRVILLEDIKGQGKKGDVVTVSDGYARNFLLKQAKAQPATGNAVSALQAQQKRKQKRQERARTLAGQAAQVIDGQSVTISKKANAQGKLFAAVSEQEIISALKEQVGNDIVVSGVHIQKTIKTTGSFTVKIDTGFGQTAQLAVVVKEL